MRVLFVHPLHPGQFGLLGRWLAKRRGYDVCVLNSLREGVDGPFRVYRYAPEPPPAGLPDAVGLFAQDHAHGVAVARTLRGMLAAGERFDLVVFHSGFGVGMFLREVVDVPVVGLFEWWFDPEVTRAPARPATAWSARRRLAAYGRNAGVLLDLTAAHAAWTSTPNQRAQLPAGLRDRVHVLPDAYDAALFHPADEDSRRVGRYELPADRPIVSFASRGLEATRGFDLFLDVAARVQRRRPDALFVVVGDDAHLYGPETHQRAGFATFREQVMAAFPGDPAQVWIQPIVPPRDLARLLRLTTVHCYLSDPFVLSWSPRDAMACGALLVAPDHAAARDLVEDGVTGLLAPLNDPDALAARVLEGIERPDAHRELRRRAAASVRARSEIGVVGPRVDAWWRRLASGDLSAAP